MMIQAGEISPETMLQLILQPNTNDGLVLSQVVGENEGERSQGTFHPSLVDANLIERLWKRKQQLSKARERDPQEAKVDLALGQHLAGARSLLGGRGRGGDFQSFLRSISMPKGRARGFIKRYEVSTKPIEPARPLTHDKVAQMATADARRLCKRLSSKDLMYQYLQSFNAALCS